MNRETMSGHRRNHCLELRIPPAVLVAIVAAAMAALAYLVPAAGTVSVSPMVAGVLALAGGLVALSGVVAFRRQETTVNPLTPEQSSSLVASGIYRFSRNPMYLGFLLCLVGWCVYLANCVAALLLPGFVMYMTRFQIQPEERALRARFGSQFEAYYRTVRRWL
jgi:protein-S-isoprenylcysteine O-methyltransferase Ste14